MARNSEKAMTALARWRSVFVDKVHEKARRRPYLATECNDLQEASRWRRDVIKEIAFKVGQIQNPGLGEFKLRDLNDEINKLFREKCHWEDRIKELGGPDYRKEAPRMLERDGQEVPGSRGYRYFGATRFLPGVRELFEADPQPPPRKTRGELSKYIDVDYYGYRDEEDGTIIADEAKREAATREIIAEEWRSRRAALDAGERPAKGAFDSDGDEEESKMDHDIYRVSSNPADEEDVSSSAAVAAAASAAAAAATYSEQVAATYRSHVPVPSQREIEVALLERKKALLLSQYMTDEMIERARETEVMMGVQTDAQMEGGLEDDEEEEEEATAAS